MGKLTKLALPFIDGDEVDEESLPFVHGSTTFHQMCFIWDKPTEDSTHNCLTVLKLSVIVKQCDHKWVPKVKEKVFQDYLDEWFSNKFDHLRQTWKGFSGERKKKTT